MAESPAVKRRPLAPEPGALGGMTGAKPRDHVPEPSGMVHVGEMGLSGRRLRSSTAAAVQHQPPAENISRPGTSTSPSASAGSRRRMARRRRPRTEACRSTAAVSRCTGEVRGRQEPPPARRGDLPSGNGVNRVDGDRYRGVRPPRFNRAGRFAPPLMARHRTEPARSQSSLSARRFMASATGHTGGGTVALPLPSSPKPSRQAAGARPFRAARPPRSGGRRPE